MVPPSIISRPSIARSLLKYCNYHQRQLSISAGLRNTEPAAATTPSSAPNLEPPHIKSIVDQISQLKFYEVTILNEALRRELKIPELQAVSIGAQAPNATEDEEASVGGKGASKTVFTVKLVKFEDAKKVALIKEIKKLVPGINLVEAKRFVEGCPKVINSNLSKEDAESLQKQLEAAGGVVKLE